MKKEDFERLERFAIRYSNDESCTLRVYPKDAVFLTSAVKRSVSEETVKIARAYMAELGEGKSDGELVDMFVKETSAENARRSERIIDTWTGLRERAGKPVTQLGRHELITEIARLELELKQTLSDMHDGNKKNESEIDDLRKIVHTLRVSHETVEQNLRAATTQRDMLQSALSRSEGECKRYVERIKLLELRAGRASVILNGHSDD